jgi:homoserine O-acetyltransferase
MADARQYFTLPSPFALKRGGELPGAQLAFETWGTPNAACDNAVLILTGLSPSAHAARNALDDSPGWWEDIVGPGKAIDTDRWFVICPNSLGSCKGSTGPASINPATGEIWRLDFPDLSLEDLGNAAFELARGLGVEKLAALVGCSMGGMAALGGLAHRPGFARAHVSVCSAPRAQPFAIAIRSLQREAIRLDPDWNEGRYDINADQGGRYPEAGMNIARKLGVITYRSALEWSGRFGRIRLDPDARDDEPFGAEFEIESYLNAHARRFTRAFDPNCYLYLSRASDWFDLAEYGDAPDPATAVRNALAKMKLERALVIGVETDILFPLEQQKQLAEDLRATGTDTTFVGLDSPQGHDAFLVDTGRFGAAIGAFMATL